MRDTEADGVAMTPITGHTWDALRATPDSVDADGNVYHESMLRSWRVLDVVAGMLERGDSNVTIETFIRYMRLGQGVPPLRVRTAGPHFAKRAEEYREKAIRLSAAIKKHHDLFGTICRLSVGDRELYEAAGIVEHANADAQAPAAEVKS